MRYLIHCDQIAIVRYHKTVYTKSHTVKRSVLLYLNDNPPPIITHFSVHAS
jgi:hypothetical protein